MRLFIFVWFRAWYKTLRRKVTSYCRRIQRERKARLDAKRRLRNQKLDSALLFSAMSSIVEDDGPSVTLGPKRGILGVLQCRLGTAHDADITIADYSSYMPAYAPHDDFYGIYGPLPDYEEYARKMLGDEKYNEIQAAIEAEKKESNGS